jgi:hypothetical protein
MALASACAPVSDFFTALAGTRLGAHDPSGVYQIPWPDQGGQYPLQKISIDGFNSPPTLQGIYAQILVSPYVVDGQLGSATPVGRFIRNKDGVMIPADYVSLQAATIHAHFERLAQLDTTLGVANRLRWPVKIGIQANVVDSKAGVIKNNAVFDKKLNALLVMPYNLDSGLPISLNAGIVAHEHFHQIFQALVLDRLPTKLSDTVSSLADHVCQWATPTNAPIELNFPTSSPDESGDESGDSETDKFSLKTPNIFAPSTAGPAVTPDIYNQFLLRGMNEGFADFWAWVYTGDAQFIGHSLPSENSRRRLDLMTVKLPSEAVLQHVLLDPSRPGQVRAENERFGIAYSVGTLYARFLREIAMKVSGGGDETLEQRMVLARVLLAALPDLAQTALSAQNEKRFLSPNAILAPLQKNLPGLQSLTCDVFVRIAADEATPGVSPVHCGSAPAEKGANP